MKKRKNWSVRIHPAGAALFILALLFAPSQLVLAAVVALLWHEISHAAVMFCLGIRSCSMELTPFGGMIDADGFEMLAPWRQALCALAGVAGSLLGAWCCPANGFGTMICQMHLSLALVNCLPAWPLDGARFLLAFSAAFGKENCARKLLAYAAYLLGILMTALGLYGAWIGEINLSLLAAGPYLAYAARQATVADRIRCMYSGRNKVKNGTVLPVKWFASTDENIQTSFSRWIGQWTQNQYHMLCELDPQGGIKHLWTEAEIWQHVLPGIGEEQK